MIRTLRAFFLGRLLREKLLLVAFICIGMLWWLSAFTSRAHAFWVEQHRTTITLQDQKRWLQNRPIIERDVEKAASQLDAAKTLDSTRLINAINLAASEAGLRSNYGTQGAARNQTVGQLTVHTVDYNVIGADWKVLEQFYLNLQKRAPYIGIESFVLSTPNRGNPSLLNLQLRLSSVEIPRS
jgi:hypothetical protein